MKATSEQSLRSQVEKWLTPCFPNTVRVTKFSRTGPHMTRYVRVESLEEMGAHALFFFWNVEGHWTVLPPRLGSPTMTLNGPQSRG